MTLIQYALAVLFATLISSELKRVKRTEGVLAVIQTLKQSTQAGTPGNGGVGPVTGQGQRPTAGGSSCGSRARPSPESFLSSSVGCGLVACRAGPGGPLMAAPARSSDGWAGQLPVAVVGGGGGV